MIEKVVETRRRGCPHGKTLSVGRPVQVGNVAVGDGDTPQAVRGDIEYPQAGQVLRNVDLGPIAFRRPIRLRALRARVGCEKGDAPSVRRPAKAPEVAVDAGQAPFLASVGGYEP